MGSMLKFDSERRELVRERRDARIERKQQRRQARERKHSPIAVAVPSAPSRHRRRSESRSRSCRRRSTGSSLRRSTATSSRQARPWQARRQCSQVPRAQPVPRRTLAASGGGDEQAPRESRRERDLAAFRERRQQTVVEARSEARRRIARAGELASVADAFAALEHREAEPWSAERRQLESALESGRIVEVGTAARRALAAVSRDAARTSRRARRDPELALAACVAYAIIARVPRTALRSAQRARPTPHVRVDRRRAFWR